MRIRNLLSFFCLTLSLYTLDIADTSANGRKRKLNQVENTSRDDELPASKRQPRALDGVGLFRHACTQAGMWAYQSANRLTTGCLHPDTESLASENEDDSTIETTPDDTEQNTDSFENIIERAHQTVDVLTSGGVFTLAIKHIEDTLSLLSVQNMKMEDLGHDTQLRFLGLFRIWSQLLHRQEGQVEIKTIKSWLAEWGSHAWLEYASDTLVDMLSHAYQLNDVDDSLPPSYYDLGDSLPPNYYDLWLDDVLINIGGPEAQAAVKFMVKASVVDDERQAFFLREAVLTGYSHPLPYLMLIDHFVARYNDEQAVAIFDMYVPAVLYNRRWTDTVSNRGSDRYKQEVRRLQKIYQDSLIRIQADTRLLIVRQNNKFLMDASLEYWPENTRSRAEDMLLVKIFEMPWSMREIFIPFAELIIERSQQRWHNDGTLSAMAAKTQDYIDNARAPRSLVTLHDKLATMLTKMGGEKEASDLLYHFVDGYREGFDTDYDIALYLIATAHALHHRGQDVEVPSYNQALELGKMICASGQKVALGERLIKIRSEAQEEEADLTLLSQLFRTIPSELTQLNPKGWMCSFFHYNLRRALQEAKERGFYTGEIPSLSELLAFTSKLSRVSVRTEYLLSSAFEYVDIEEITGLYLEGLTRLKKESISDKSLALQWMSASRWLAEHDQGIQAINHLEDALALIESTPTHEKKQMYQSLMKIRDDKWLNGRSAEAAKSVADRYKRHMENREKYKGKTRRELISNVALGGYYEHPVTGDGLCLYHALSAMYGVTEEQLIAKMLSYLKVIYVQIQTNLSEGQQLLSHLSETQIQAVTPILMTAVSGNAIHLQELDLQLNSLSAALTQISTGIHQGGQAWGSVFLLNTAAVVLNEEFGINAPVSALIGEGGAMNLHVFYGDGHSDSDSTSANGQPLLIHNANHWVYATQSHPQSQPQSLEPLILLFKNMFLGDDNSSPGWSEQMKTLEARLKGLSMSGVLAKFSSF